MAIELEPLPPAEAVAFFRSKGYLTGFSWRDVSAEQHGQAFTVAKAMRLDVMEAIRGELDRALAGGTTFQDFRKTLTPRLKELGWWGRKPMFDELTGETIEAQLGSDRRLRIIYDANLRAAHAAGHWTRIQATKQDLPYLRYVAVLDGRTRPQHRAWHGTLLPVDHVFWQTHYPPNGWRCRCQVQQVSEGQMRRRGWQVTEPPPESGPGRAHVNRRTGEVIEAPAGIDPGWGHNPGMAAEGRFPDPARYTDADWGHAAARAAVESPHFEDIVRGTAGGAAPVAWLDEALAAAIGTDVQRVDLSADTMRKQRGELPGNPGHPELTLVDYRRLPDLIGGGSVYSDRERSLLIFSEHEGRFYRIALKATADGQAAFLTSFTKVRRENALRQQRRRRKIDRGD
ncbi:phage minor head protein [Minwuia thermotolerans]|uniref:Head morphogenesis protein n=1 Tax=Minwuia thermotolerans TaxID=2056226 RepID=A0A2M9G4T8_9PROT|nr:phage minor head protein [Minwuia thermotolerans]PJK29324.1 head morphogenesis protein [Minwuia thermotolerans]PJK30491.1 head morphogenesis protein [Minwuia thermotolerans]PJK30714.1 head morphogenesis protein [Minwuia thermotolerans]